MARTVRPSRNKLMRGRFTMAANQTSNFAVGQHLEFDTTVGDFPVSTGVGQVKGRITLPGGRWYVIRWNYMCGASTSGWLNTRLYDVTNAAWVAASTYAAAQTTNVAIATSQQPVASVELYVPSTIQVELQIVGVGAAINLVYASYSVCEIQELPV